MVFLIFFKLDKLVEDYQLIFPSEPFDVDFCCLGNIHFSSNFFSFLEISWPVPLCFNKKNKKKYNKNFT
jgi:hypothetical protein